MAPSPNSSTLISPPDSFSMLSFIRSRVLKYSDDVARAVWIFSSYFAACAGTLRTPTAMHMDSKNTPSLFMKAP